MSDLQPYLEKAKVSEVRQIARTSEGLLAKVKVLMILVTTVVLISAGLDEAPMGYKDIDSVMAAQSDLVEIVARFDPRLVKMAPEGERPED